MAATNGNGNGRHPKSFSKFTHNDLAQFGLKLRDKRLFPNVTQQQPSQWLMDALADMPEIKMGSEKSKSEFTVAPIVKELVRRNRHKFAVYSGYALHVDESLGLVGVCDLMFSKVPDAPLPEAPVFFVVEAKNENLESGIPQCIAEMYASHLFNKLHKRPVQRLFGAVTFGDKWRFLELEGTTAWVDTDAYYQNNLPALLGALQHIIDLI